MIIQGNWILIEKLLVSTYTFAGTVPLVAILIPHGVRHAIWKQRNVQYEQHSFSKNDLHTLYLSQVIYLFVYRILSK